MDIKSALIESVTDLQQILAIQLFAIFSLFRFGNAVLSTSMQVKVQQGLQQIAQQNGNIESSISGTSTQAFYILDIPPVAILGLLIATVYIAEMLNMITIRGFAWRSESISDKILYYNLPSVAFHGVIAGIISLIAIVIGFGLLIIPGIYIAAGLLFVRQEIAVNNKQFIEAIVDSWELTDGCRIRLAGVAIGLFLLDGVISAAVVTVGLAPAITTGIQSTVSSVIHVYIVVVITNLYTQVVDISPPDIQIGE